MDDQAGTEYIDMGTPVANTRQTMGKYEIVKIRIPSDKQQGPSPVEDITCTYRMTTDENAAFVVGKSWYQSVGSCYFLDVAGDATTHYGGTEVLRVDGLSTQYFNGGVKQVVTNDGEQAVTSNWTQKVSGKNHGQYGSWDVKVKATSKTTAGGDISLISTGGSISVSAMGGEVTVISPTRINLVAPAIQTKASGWWKGYSPSSAEYYVSKIAIGAHKSDYVVAVYTCGYGVKLETTGMSFARTGVKVDIASVKGDNKSLGVKNASVEAANITSKLGKFGVNIMTAGMTKL